MAADDMAATSANAADVVDGESGSWIRATCAC